MSTYQALVLGSSGAIGQAWLSYFQADSDCRHAVGLSRSSSPAFDLQNEDSMADCAAALRSDSEQQGSGPFHWIIDATGALTIDGVGPEKRIDALNAQHLLKQFEINAVGPALLMKHFSPLLATNERAVYATLSARVGSIEDNHKGGWYGYRAAKAARNMLLQTAAIELSRKRPLAVFAALQPGTVESRLSSPFVSAGHTITPQLAVSNLMTVLIDLPANGRAHFVDHAGQHIPW
jgi:NAD(P)-dependent dehydrogenase (short-subunit alcohol dehydrogenase family)